MNDIDKKTVLNPDGTDAPEEPNFDNMSEQELREFIKTGLATIKTNYDKGAQKVINEKNSVETKMDAIKAVAKDPKALVEIQKLNDALAKQILDEVYDGISFEQFKVQKVEGENDVISQKIFENQVRTRLAKIKKQLPSELGDKFQNKFDKLTAGERVNEETLDEFINEALSVINKPNQSQGMPVVGSGVGRPTGGSMIESTTYKADPRTKSFVQRVTGRRDPNKPA